MGRYKYGCRNQAKGKENYLFNSILDENRAGLVAFGSYFFLFISFFRMGQSCYKRGR